MLHLTCHGNVVNTPTGALAVLSLENKDGSHDPLTGADLLNMSPRGVLRMVLLSSCMTATGSQAQLAQLPPEQRAQAEAQIRKGHEEFQRMSPAQQAAVRDQQRRVQIDNAANQVRDAGLAYVRKQAPKRDVVKMLEDMSAQMKDGESAGSAWLEVAALCDALSALINEESIPPVPAAYASHFSAVESEKRRMNKKRP